MIRYLIVDDEYIAHEIIEGYCAMLPDMVLQKNCYDAIEALSFLKQQSVDLIFLDLNMPKLKGFDFLRTLLNPPKIIVTTAYREHALEGYALNVVDYLLKPFSFERFLQAVNKASDPAPLAKPQVKSPTVTEPRRIFLKENKIHHQVDVHDIRFLEAAGNYTKIFLTDQLITVREKISDLYQKLPAAAFVRVHKSFVVAIRHIDRVEGNRINIGGAEVPIGKRYKLEFDRLLG